MTINGACIGVSCGSSQQGCPDKFGCPPGVCPDFTLKRHDTKPAFKVSVEDCDGILDLSDESLILEANIWAKAKLKTAIDESDVYFGFADHIGFEQAMVGDIIIMDRVRLPEHMLVIGFDETNRLIQVQRAYNGTTASNWKKGTSLRIFRALNAPAGIETILDDVVQEDGTTATDQLVETFLVFEWDENTTCLPGCYWLEFKLMKMLDSSEVEDSSTDTTTSSLTPVDFGCSKGAGVDWVRRFPSEGEGFLIKISGSPTTELV